MQVEIPNEQRDAIELMDLFFSPEFMSHKGTLPIVLGKSIMGNIEIADLTTMPHLLVAGTTGSGKSVGVNGMILSLLMRFSAEQCKFLFIDPKMLELSIYDGIPHLLEPTVTDPRKAIDALQRVVDEMDRRYQIMANMRVRNIANYNEVAKETLPYIVVVIDEFADLANTAGKALEALVQRIAQKARAAGIHLIMATQRPSVDVVTGVIKANFPTRISYRVASSFDSKTILGETGAETLLGKGDMLIMEGSQTRRIHGAFISDIDVEVIADNLRDNIAAPVTVQEPVIVAAPVVTEQPVDSINKRVLAAIGRGIEPKPFVMAKALKASVFDIEKALMEVGVWKGI